MWPELDTTYKDDIWNNLKLQMQTLLFQKRNEICGNLNGKYERLLLLPENNLSEEKEFLLKVKWYSAVPHLRENNINV